MAGTSTGVSLLSCGTLSVKNLAFWLDGSSVTETIRGGSVSGSLNISSTTPVSAPLGSYYTTSGLTSTSLTYPVIPPFTASSVQLTVGVWLRVTTGTPTTANYEILKLVNTTNSLQKVSLVLSRNVGNWYVYADSLYGTTGVSAIAITPNVWTFVGLKAYTNGTSGFVEAFSYLGDDGSGNGVYTTSRKNASGSSSYDLGNNPVVMNTNSRGSGTEFFIDSLGIWSSVLSYRELDSVANHGAGRTYAQLQAL